MEDEIVIRKANQHNLKDVSLKIPKNKLVVFTGVSGSGKSSLAFDTIFAEGQRRYVESLSVYARQFLGQMDKPDVESIEGLSPAIAIDQKQASSNPRSTVATATEIYDYLRLLFARIGTAHCPKCGNLIEPQSIDEIVDKILKIEKVGTKIQILSPIVRGKKGEYSSLFDSLRQEGFIRVKVDGKVYTLDEDLIDLKKTQKHNIDIVVDRLIIDDKYRSRIDESVQIALKESKGLVVVDIVDMDEQVIFSENLSCPKCNISFEELNSRLFSFNAPYGACPKCNGLGVHFEIDENLIIPDRKKSLNEGAIFPWHKTGNPYYHHILLSVSNHFSIDMDTPFENLPQEQQKIILYGSNGELLKFRYPNFGDPKRFDTRSMEFLGVVPYFMKKYKETNSNEVKEEVQKYMSFVVCEKCKGARLNDLALSVKVGGLNIYEVCKMPIEKSFEFISDLFFKLDEYKMKIGKQILTQIRDRLRFLLDVGLGYIDLARMTLTLSGGEAQRIRLATQIGSGLSGVLYVLDEPSIGLHQRDNDRLIETLIKLRNLNNTLIVVEHDEDTIRKADYIVDIGPLAGVNGGKIVAQGSLEDIEREKDSITGKYLSKSKRIEVPEIIRSGNGKYLEIKNASLNNLKNIDVKIPLGKIVVLTGVSGSGKSTLMQDLIFQYSQHVLKGNRPKPFGVEEIVGFENIDKVIDIDQQPIGRTPRSNPATYTDVFTYIREVFSKTPQAKLKGYKPGRFSFNVKGGRCDFCRGDGEIKIEMIFLCDVYVKCKVCEGRRYNRETLEVKYKGKDIAEVLDMSIQEALEFFENIPRIRSRLKTLCDVGLGYIKLGQSSTTLSGGEAQRIKLASQLNRKSTGKTLYMLDEPSTGLHWYDLDKLIKILHKLADSGNTILIIEHNLDLIKTADWIIDLGPQGGQLGGNVIFEGTVEEIIKSKSSYTGIYLRKFLGR